MAFFLETLIGGLMAGMLYSLVALGFVLIYKASGVFNFAQGAMVLFAALAMATLGIPYFLEGLGQTLFGSDIYKIDVGMPKEPIFAFDTVFQGGILINK